MDCYTARIGIERSSSGIIDDQILRGVEPYVTSLKEGLVC